MKVALISAAAAIAYQIGIRILRKVHRAPAPAFIGWFLDSPMRRALQPPERLIERSGIAKGMRVLEVGCGSGAYTTTAARAVGGSGTVYALDIQSGMLRQLEHKIAHSGDGSAQNITLTQARASELPYPGGTFDRVTLVTVLQEVSDRSAALAEIARVLRPGGMVAVSELLIDPDYVLKSTTIRDLAQAGFRIAGAPGGLMDYTVTARRP